MSAAQRKRHVLDVLVEAFAEPIKDDPAGFRTKFRKMAADPYAFYRGSAPLFYADMADAGDAWASNDDTRRVWIHGDLHAENFGTYMNSEGVLVFDVNDFDEAYVGHFTWDLRRFVASLSLLGWQKALPEAAVRSLVGTYLDAYVDQVHHYVEEPQDESYALRLDNTEGAILDALRKARTSTRVGLLESLTLVEEYDRRFGDHGGTRKLGKAEHRKVERAFAAYLETIPQSKRRADVNYEVKDVVGRVGSGVGSAGLPTYNVLIEGFNQALENDVVLEVKRGNVAAVSRVVDDADIRGHFRHEGHRTVVSQRQLQVHADPFLGHTEIDGVGFLVDEVSPYEYDLDWSELTEPDEIDSVLAHLGRATAKVHCVSDEDSEEHLVNAKTEDAIASVVDADPDGFAADLADFGLRYAERTRKDHELFVTAFREGEIPGVPAT